MKFKFEENNYGMSVTLIPETPLEVAKLFRFTNNAKQEKPDVFLSFAGDEPYLHVSMRKIADRKRCNSVSPRRRAK